MSTPEVWTAVELLGRQWSRSPLVRQLTDALPSVASPSGEITTALQYLNASMNDVVSCAPLWTTAWEALAEQLPILTVTDELRQFLRAVRPVGHATEVSLGWVRSRLPGFPSILVPQLAARASRRCEECGDHLPWTRQMLGAGLQYQPSPGTLLTRIFGAPVSAGISSATVVLAEALARTPQWQTFAALHRELEDVDRDALRAARSRVNTALSGESVDSFEPEHMYRRQKFRDECTDDAIESLADRPRAYAAAFGEVDHVVDLAALHVLGQIACFGTPQRAHDVEIVELTPECVRYTDHGDFLTHLGGLVRLSDPVVREVLRITGISISSDGSTSRTNVSVTGRRLPGTADALAN
ncbi:hypothetical protein [Mycobacterium kansasii]|uniref:hypothetical protein n=1 Tax=Mycobacterium kansasii TaxID=1768 RepID=UPI000B2C5114|nr:hypothetical protein [Mycobacterium kansasii]